MLTHKIWGAIALIMLGVGLYVGKTYYPIVQTTEVEKEVIKRDVVTIVKEVTNKDGTKTVETIITDKTKEKKESTETKVSATRLPDYAATLTAQTPYNVLKPVYGLQLDKRIGGPLWVVLGVNQEKEVTIGVKYEF